MNSLRQNLLEVIKPASQTTLKNVVVFVHYIIPYKNLKIEINFHASYFLFGELKDQLLSMGGGGKGAENFEDHMVFRGGAEGGISRLQQHFKGDFRSFTANGGGGVFGVLRILQSLWEDQVNFIMTNPPTPLPLTKPKSSDPSPLNDKQ